MCTFRVLNPHQWSLAKQSSLTLYLMGSYIIYRYVFVPICSIWLFSKNKYEEFYSLFNQNRILGTSKIEEVPRGIWGEKSSKDMASSRNLVSTIGAQASPTMVGRNQVSGRVSVPCWHATPVANAPWKPLNRWRPSSVSRSWNWWKVWLVGKSLLVKDQNVI